MTDSSQLTTKLYSGLIYRQKLKSYADSQLKPYSHYHDPIDHTAGRLTGNSRDVGDASATTQEAVIDLVLQKTSAHGDSAEDIAMILAIIHKKSGFNPDAASNESASGLGQFLDGTWEGERENETDEAFDAGENIDVMINYLDDIKRTAARNGLGSEYYYALWHQGEGAAPQYKNGLDDEWLKTSKRDVMPYYKSTLSILKAMGSTSDGSSQDVNATQPEPNWLKFLINLYTTDITLPVSPLILALDGDGIELTSRTGAGAKPVYWDIDNDGFKEASAWVKSDDGLLVMDRNGNGTIDNHSELFGNSTTDGFSALSALDSNKDGKITSADANFSKLRVWRDLNQDGVSQSKELFTLSQLGITSIKLASKAVNYQIAGNKVTNESTYTLANGTTCKIVDAWFNYDNVNSTYNGSFTLNPETLLLPQLRGYGTVPDLYIAMSKSTDLLKKVKALNSVNPLTATVTSVNSMVRGILWSWAGVQGVSPDGRGPGIDGRDIAFVEKLFDQSASPDTGGYMVQALRGRTIENIFSQMVTNFGARLLLQGPAQAFFTQAPSYNPVTDSFSGSYALNYTAIDGMSAGKTLAQKYSQWAMLLAVIDGSVGLASLSTGDVTALTSKIAASDTSGMLTYDILAHAGFGTPRLGTSGNNTLTGANNVDDVIIAGAGNDTINGTTGNDHIYAGAGNDTISITTSYRQPGALIDGSAGIDTLTTNTTDISDITITNIETLVTTGNIYLTGAQLAGFQNVSADNWATVNGVTAGTYDLSTKSANGSIGLNGSAGNDTLIGDGYDQNLNGNEGNDTLKGLGGSDNLYGGAGNDTIIYDLADVDVDGGEGIDTLMLGGATKLTVNLASTDDQVVGGGADTIVENDAMAGNSDSLKLGTGIARDQLWFTHQNNDLFIRLIGTTDSVDIKNWFRGTANHVKKIQTVDGHVLTDAKVINLVNAMASLTVPSATTLTTAQHTQLDTVIAANWT